MAPSSVSAMVCKTDCNEACRRLFTLSTVLAANALSAHSAPRMLQACKSYHRTRDTLSTGAMGNCTLAGCQVMHHYSTPRELRLRQLLQQQAEPCMCASPNLRHIGYDFRSSATRWTQNCNMLATLQSFSLIYSGHSSCPLMLLDGKFHANTPIVHPMAIKKDIRQYVNAIDNVSRSGFRSLRMAVLCTGCNPRPCWQPCCCISRPEKALSHLSPRPWAQLKST